MKIKIKPLLVCLIYGVSVVLAMVSDAYAGAWTNKKGETILMPSIFYAPYYKYSAALEGEDDGGNAYNSEVASKIRYKGVGGELSYGYSNDLTLIGNAEIYDYTDHLTIMTSQNGATPNEFTISTDYEIIRSKWGARYRLYHDELSVMSLQGMIYPGDFVVKNSASHISKTIAGELSLLYGQAFDLPFGFATRPKQGGYIDLAAGYKFYPNAHHHEFDANASLGMRPFSEDILLVVGLYNTFNGYDYTKRPFNIDVVNNSIDGLGIIDSPAVDLKDEALKALRSKSNFAFHQINFQVGYDLSKYTTLYLQSFHNVLKGKPFKYNSYYASLEYKF